MEKIKNEREKKVAKGGEENFLHHAHEKWKEESEKISTFAHSRSIKMNYKHP